MSDLRLYSMPSSGNSYKVRLFLALLGRNYTHISCEHASEALTIAKTTGKAPMGKVPSLELEDGDVLTESDAILWYLAEGTDWLPRETLPRAKVLAWMFFEQNRHEPVIAVRASLNFYPERRAQATPERMADLLEAGHGVLQIMEDQLSDKDWLETDRPTVADLALYAYTHTAGSRGGFDMARYPAIGKWCARISALPGYIPLDEIPD